MIDDQLQPSTLLDASAQQQRQWHRHHHHHYQLQQPDQQQLSLPDKWQMIQFEKRLDANTEGISKVGE